MPVSLIDPISYVKEEKKQKVSSQKTVTKKNEEQYDKCYPFDFIHKEQPCFKVEDIKKNGFKLVHRGFKDNTLMNYAYELGGIDFVLTLNAENGGRDHVKKSPVNSNGYRDVGLCQLNLAYHAEFYNTDYFKNPYAQLRYCYDVYSKAIESGRIKTTFYGYNVRQKRNVGSDGKPLIYVKDSM